jgi:hypothetical protein
MKDSLVVLHLAGADSSCQLPTSVTYIIPINMPSYSTANIIMSKNLAIANVVEDPFISSYLIL